VSAAPPALRPPRTGWRTAARDTSLLFCAGLAGYLVSILLAARLGVFLVGALPGEHSTLVRLLLGTLVLDLTKAPGLLLLAWGLGRILAIRPTTGAALLLGFCYGLELLAMLAMGQTGGLSWPALLCRIVAAGLIFAAARWILIRRARTV
jgi:hypothetical protein